MMTQSQFVSNMNMLAVNVFAPLQQSTAMQNLAPNLVLLMTGEFFMAFGGSSSGAIAFTATPSVVFNRGDIVASIGSAKLICPVPCSVAFSVPTSSYLMAFPAAAFISECAIPTNASMHGYFYSSTPAVTPSVQMKVDTQSMMVAMGTNMGFTMTANLEEVFPSPQLAAQVSFHFNYKGLDFSIREYYVVKYPGMTPIGCLFIKNGTEFMFCIVQFQNLLALPIFNQFGANYTRPSFCNWYITLTLLLYCCLWS